MYKKIIFLLFVCFGIAIGDSRLFKIEPKEKNILSLFLQCANEKVSSCKKILESGFLDQEKCDIDDCAIIGATLHFAQREDEAIPYLTKACNMGKFQSCTNLGLLYQNTHDMKNAKYFYSTACNHNEEIACYNLGLLYTNKNLLEENPQLAIQLFKKACSAFYPKACYNAAILYATKQDKNLPLAKFYFDKSCDLGLLKACENMQYFHKRGIQMPQPKKYRALYIH